MDLNLTNKRALVCGSTQGIGKETAKELAELGASVTLVARNEERLREVMGELDTTKGQGHHFLAVDFSYPEQLKERVADHVTRVGTCHILVNNTGGPPGGPALDADPEEYRTAFTAHLICNQVLAQTVVPGMKEVGYGRIINVISTSVKQPIPNLGVSNTVRGAVANWAKTLAGELGPFKITVNNVLPGPTNTQRLTNILQNKSKKTGKSYEEAEKAMMSAVPIGRAAEPEETAAAISFLASPAAAYITGTNMPVDGGRTGCL